MTPEETIDIKLKLISHAIAKLGEIDRNLSVTEMNKLADSAVDLLLQAQCY